MKYKTGDSNLTETIKAIEHFRSAMKESAEVFLILLLPTHLQLKILFQLKTTCAMEESFENFFLAERSVFITEAVVDATLTIEVVQLIPILPSSREKESEMEVERQIGRAHV